jgi:hypothetical protein
VKVAAPPRTGGEDRRDEDEIIQHFEWSPAAHTGCLADDEDHASSG